METSQAYYINKMNDHLSLKQRANPNYSLRAFSRDLGIHSSTLCQIIKGKRRLPIKHASSVVERMSLSPKEKTLFMESLYRSKTNIDNIKIDSTDQRYILDESYHKVIAEWEHYAVLELFNLENFDAKPKEISDQLGITLNRSEVVLKNLITSGLLKEDDRGKLVKTHEDIKTTEDVSSKALKESHLETLEMGKNKLEEIEVELRDFSSATVAIDLDKLPEAKTIIREFRQKMSALLRDGEKTDVYQLAIQFYPLTENAKKSIKEKQ